MQPHMARQCYDTLAVVIDNLSLSSGTQIPHGGAS